MCLGIPGEVVAVGTERPDLATVEVAGVRRAVNVGLFADGELAPGDWVLIHVGFAMSKIDQEEAAATLAYLDSMEQAYADELRALADSSIE